MKKIVSIALVSAALGTAAHAAPFLAIGDGAELFITGTLGVRADDNIFLASSGSKITTGSLKGQDAVKSDTIFDINPGVEITFGKDATMKGALTLVDAFANYSDNSGLNTQLFSGDFRVAYDDSKLKLKFNTGYHELNQNTVDNTGLTRRNEFVIGGTGESEISQIASASLGANFNHTSYHRAGYGNSDDLNIPVNFYYKWTPKTDLSLGYRYRDYKNTAAGAKDSTDNYFNIGARGEFSEKLTGTVTVGVTNRNLSNGTTTTTSAFTKGSKTLPGVEASLTYKADEKTTIQLGATNDFGTSPQGQQQKNLTLNGAVSVAIDAQWSVNAGLSWRSIDYYTRTDDYIEGTIGAGYIINSWVKLNAGYTYRKNSSDLATSEFKGNVFSLAASLRY